jgi:hypothetical protein
MLVIGKDAGKWQMILSLQRRRDLSSICIMYLLFNLEGKSTIVTDAGRGLGQAMANALAQAGAVVAVFDVNREDAESAAAAIRASGGQAIAIAIDVTDSQGAGWDSKRGGSLRWGRCTGQ